MIAAPKVIKSKKGFILTFSMNSNFSFRVQFETDNAQNLIC